MKLTKVFKKTSDGDVTLYGDVWITHLNKSETVYFRYPERFDSFITESADPFFPALLIPAMLYGEDLEILPGLSSKLFYQSKTIQEIFSAWNRGELSYIDVKAPKLLRDDSPKSERNATFFSLGVDSMYTMLKHIQDNTTGQPLTNLIFMKGLELPLSIYTDNKESQIEKKIVSFAEHYNLEVISGQTNIRDVFPLNYEKHYFGPCLAATALSLSDGLDNIFIPSSNSYSTIYPDPSNPLTDPMWSSEKLFIHHDGAEKERARKISDIIAHDNYALDNLRVCVENNGEDYNCGKCWKCIRTMVSLDIIDKLKDSKAFPGKLPKHFTNELNTYDELLIEFVYENYRLAKDYHKLQMAEILHSEIRVGEMDILRNDKGILFLFREVFFYYYMKLLKFLKLKKHLF